MERSTENTFVIEVCENCRAHNWNTRHDENKYKNYANESKFKKLYSIEFCQNKGIIMNDFDKLTANCLVAAKIQEATPGVVVLINEVPKPWVDFEIYCQLIPNTDPSIKTYKILPRIGAFEVSFKGVVRFT